MRFIGICFSLVVLSSVCLCADLKIKIIDPQSAVVAGALQHRVARGSERGDVRDRRAGDEGARAILREAEHVE